MEAMLRRKYDSNLAFHLFNANFPAEDVIIFAAPLIHILATTRFRYVDGYDMEDAKAEAFMDLMVHFDRRLWEYEEEKKFHYDCWWIIYRAFKRQLSFNQQEALDTESLHRSRLPHPRDFDRQNWLDQVPQELQGRVIAQVRFEGNRLGACEYILRAMLDARTPNSTVLRRDYGIDNPQFYIDYVRILFRKSLYEIHEDPATYDSLLKEVTAAKASWQVNHMAARDNWEI